MNKDLKPFDKVLVRHKNKLEWKIDLFERYLEHRELPYLCMHDCWRYCIPYEGNEHLLGTTESPKPKRWRAEKGGMYYFLDDELYVKISYEGFTDIGDNRYSSGNYFKTEEEAKAIAEKIKKILNR